MLSTGPLLAFALTAFVLIAIPGPSVLFTVGRALTIGRRGALLTVLGNAAGLYVQVVAVALGVAAVVARSAEAYTALRLAGAAYLVHLGVQAIRHRRAGTGSLPDVPARHGRVVRDGFVVGVTNPKMIVFLAAVLPQFVDPGGISPVLQMLVLGAVVLVIALVSDAAWALGAGTVRVWFARSPRRVAALGVSGGMSMVGLGVGLAVTGRRE